MRENTILSSEIYKGDLMLKKIEGYVFNVYLLKAFITNLEVVITISTDSLPTTYRQITNRQLTVGRQIVTTVEKLVGRQLAVCRPTVGQQSVEVSCSSLLPTFLPLCDKSFKVTYHILTTESSVFQYLTILLHLCSSN